MQKLQIKQKRMNVAIIKYNAGNIFSVDYALRRLGIEPIITADKAILQKADKIIFSEEGDVDCLGIFDAEVKRFHSLQHEDKVPHMGWNTITHLQSKLFEGLGNEEFVYFVHSYYVPLNECTAAQTDYILPYSSALHKDNFYATQFHPEKSGKNGEKILSNFLDL